MCKHCSNKRTWKNTDHDMNKKDSGPSFWELHPKIAAICEIGLCFKAVIPLTTYFHTFLSFLSFQSSNLHSKISPILQNEKKNPTAAKGLCKCGKLKAVCTRDPDGGELPIRVQSTEHCEKSYSSISKTCKISLKNISKTAKGELECSEGTIMHFVK